MTAVDDAALGAALAAIDAVNAEDPNLVVTPDGSRPKELVHAERMTAWLAELDPAAEPAQRLAARAHHFRRWASPRSDYPEGRAGYLRWRSDARKRHATEVGELLAAHGIPTDVVADVAAIIRKEGLGTDRRVQIHEDALCLTFFELQGLETAGKLGDKTGPVVAKTLAKMSVRGRQLLLGADLDSAVRAVVADELATLDGD